MDDVRFRRDGDGTVGDPVGLRGPLRDAMRGFRKIRLTGKTRTDIGVEAEQCQSMIWPAGDDMLNSTPEHDGSASEETTNTVPASGPGPGRPSSQEETRTVVDRGNWACSIPLGRLP